MICLGTWHLYHVLCWAGTNNVVEHHTTQKKVPTSGVIKDVVLIVGVRGEELRTIFFDFLELP